MKTFLKNSSLGLLRFIVSSAFVATLAACAEKGDDIQPQPSTTGQVYKFTITTDDNWNKNNSTPVAAPSLGHYQLELEGKVASSELWLEATELVGISNGSFLRSQQRQVADEARQTNGYSGNPAGWPDGPDGPAWHMAWPEGHRSIKARE